MQSHHKRTSPWLVATATAGLLALAGGTQAAEQDKSDAQPQATPASELSSGMKVYIDPKTGAFREATMEERQAEALAPNKASAAAAKAKPGTSVVPLTRARNGTMIAHDTEGALAEYLTVEIGADGAQHFRCVHGVDSHVGAVASTPAAEEK